ncbi:hypothetical protein DFS34DRAFT_117162 [Phlyctochytrium arcticum]|nr:hypothetical protein DFS34DRAFT_117162 [Phlyctochytrium arcticum]
MASAVGLVTGLFLGCALGFGCKQPKATRQPPAAHARSSLPCGVITLSIRSKLQGWGYSYRGFQRELAAVYLKEIDYTGNPIYILHTHKNLQNMYFRIVASRPLLRSLQATLSKLPVRTYAAAGYGNHGEKGPGQGDPSRPKPATSKSDAPPKQKDSSSSKTKSSSSDSQQPSHHSRESINNTPPKDTGGIPPVVNNDPHGTFPNETERVDKSNKNTFTRT